jgi:hypothetical protein
LNKVLTVKRNEVISSLKKMKKASKRTQSGSKKDRGSSQKPKHMPPIKRTPKKCDFIATTESIKHLKRDPRNTSPKIELFSPKKQQEFNGMSRKNIERYESST